MKKILFLLLALLLMVGCAKEEPKKEDPKPAETGKKDETKPAESGKKLVVYGIYKAGDQTWFIQEGAAAKKAVEAAGGEFIYVDAKMSPEEYLKAIDNAIANKASGIVTCIPDQKISQAVVDKVKEAKIPIVAADDALQDESGKKIAPWVGINAYVIGQANGEFLAKQVNEKKLTGPEVGYMILTMDTVSSVVPRTKGQLDKFKELAPNFDEKRIFHADYDGTTDKGNQAATTLIAAHPEIKTWLVTTGNEEGAIGALRAIETAGLDKNSIVIGLGAYLAKDEWNNKGADGTAMKAATYFSAEQIGEGSIKVLLDLIAGKEVPLEKAVDAIIVTPENYKEVMGDYAK